MLDGRGYVYDVRLYGAAKTMVYFFVACDGSIGYAVIVSRILKGTALVNDGIGCDRRYGQ